MNVVTEFCAICQENIKGSPGTKLSRTSMAFVRRVWRKNTIVKLQPCGHEFHHPCISKWVQKKPLCPLDKSLITDSTPALSCIVNLRNKLFKSIEMNQINDLRKVLSAGYKPEQPSIPDRHDPLALSANLEHWQIAAELLRAGWTTNDKVALFQLGRMYHHGLGGEKNYAEALTLYSKAAVQGFAGAENSLGCMHTQGLGVQQNYAVALSWFHKAAAQGYAYAQFNLGCMCFEGQGVEQNKAEALTWFRKAADQGVAMAQYNLGRMFLDGLGVAQNDAEARTWLSKAVDQGLDLAQKALAKMDAAKGS